MKHFEASRLLREGIASMRPDNPATIKRISDLFASPDAASKLSRQAHHAFQIPFYFLKMLAAGNIQRLARPVDADSISLVYRAILQRHPESESILAEQQARFATLADLIDFLLCCQEWKLRALELFLRAFPDASRLWHPHIPKTAGTSFFAAAMQAGTAYFNTNILSSAQTLPEIADIFRIPKAKEPLLISGHFPLCLYAGLMQPFDQSISFIRDPLERAKSMFQYARDVTDGSDSVHKGDPANFVSIGFVYDSFDQSFENGFFGQNPQCEYLGAEPTFAAVIEATRLAGLNIGSVDDVDQAISAFLGKHKSIRMNVSRNAAVQWNLPPSLIARFKAAHSEDEKLYQAFVGRRSPMASEHQIKPVASRATAAAPKRPSASRARWKPQWLS